MSDQLLPCAHCGSPAEFMKVERENTSQGGEYIDCTNKACGATSVLMFALGEDVKPLLADRWNLRAALSQRAPISDAEITDMSVLREVVMAAIEHGESIGEENWYDGISIFDLSRGTISAPDAILMAACTPVEILALINKLDAAERDLHWYTCTNEQLSSSLLTAQGAEQAMIICPTYFVRHPDDSYSVADPQPVLAVQGDAWTTTSEVITGNPVLVFNQDEFDTMVEKGTKAWTAQCDMSTQSTGGSDMSKNDAGIDISAEGDAPVQPWQDIDADLRVALVELGSVLQMGTASIDAIHELGPDSPAEEAWQIFYDDIIPMLNRAPVQADHDPDSRKTIDTIRTLTKYNQWRRTGAPDTPDPKIIGDAD